MSDNRNAFHTLLRIFTLAYDGRFHHHSAKKMSVHKQNAEIRSELVRGGRKREARDRERMGECRDAEEE